VPCVLGANLPVANLIAGWQSVAGANKFRRMKILSALALFSLLAFSIATAQEKPPVDKTGVTLTREQRIQFRRLLNDASDYFKQKKLDRALEKLDAAEAIFPNFVEEVNMRGAVYAEKRDFVKADELFDRALELEPRAFWPKFNKAEVLLMQGKYADAQMAFEVLLVKVPTSEMVQFKLVLVHLMEKDLDGAKSMLDKMKFPSDSAAYYYANAAIEFARGKREDGEYWIKSGDAIFGFERNMIFYDSLADLGWLDKRAP
jgi:tetratricopeptide (TPR) repeat protein